MKLVKFGFLVFVLTLMSCSKDVDLSNHQLVGLYSGMWDSSPSVVDVEIAASDEKDKLEFSLSIFNSHDLVILSDSEFTISRFEQTGRSMEITGELIGDTLYVENDYFLISDPSDSGIRVGKFARVE